MVNLDYIAGFFDGEGSIHYAISRGYETASKWRIQIWIDITQKNPEILHQIKNSLNLGWVKPDRGYFRLQMAGKLQCSRFVNLMIDRVHVKRE